MTGKRKFAAYDVRAPAPAPVAQNTLLTIAEPSAEAPAPSTLRESLTNSSARAKPTEILKKAPIYLFIAVPFIVAATVGVHAVTQAITKPYEPSFELGAADTISGLLVVKILITICFYSFGAYIAGQKYTERLVVFPLFIFSASLLAVTVIQWMLNIFYSSQAWQLAAAGVAFLIAIVLGAFTHAEPETYFDFRSSRQRERTTTLAHSRFTETAPPRVSDPEI